MRVKFLSILFLLLIPASLWAQKSKPWNKPLYDGLPYHFGFSFSVGTLDFAVNHVPDFAAVDASGKYVYDSVMSVEGIANPVLGASVVGVLKLNPSFDLRFSPGLAFGQRNLEYRMITGEKGDSLVNHTMKIESAYIQFPFNLKYRATREGNYRPYFVGGLNYTMDLASAKQIKDEEKPKIRLNRHDILAEIGFGIDYYLPYFKFSTELKFSYGLLNIVNYDDMQQTAIFDRLGTKMVTLAIYFE